MSIATLSTIDPILSSSYHVEIQGVVIAQFQKVDGLSIEISTIEHRENKMGGLPIMRKLPGHVKYADITLARGKVTDTAFFDWIGKVQAGNIAGARTSGSVVLFDFTHGEIQRFNFVNAWPSKVNLGSLAAGGNDVLLENVTIVHEGLSIG